MSAFWIGLPIGIVLGTFLAFLIVLLFMGVIPRLGDQNLQAQSRIPMVMMFQGRLISVFHA